MVIDIRSHLPAHSTARHLPPHEGFFWAKYTGGDDDLIEAAEWEVVYATKVAIGFYSPYFVTRISYPAPYVLSDFYFGAPVIEVKYDQN